MSSVDKLVEEISPFPDIEGRFELADVPGGQLDDAGALEEGITEQQIRDLHWRLSFKRVQYGTYEEAPACLVVVEARFHAERIKRHRFTWARISAQFSGEQGAVEVRKLAPERAHGIHVAVDKTSRWAISSSISVTVPGVPVTIDLFNASLGHFEKYRIDRVASMQGSRRGMPKSREAVWTLNEAKEEGVPLCVPSMVMVLKCDPGSTFVAKFAVQAKVNASFRPSSWQPLQGPTQHVAFDGKTELLDRKENVSGDFSILNLSKLTKLNFAEG